MSWLNNITVRTKIIGAFALVLAVTVGLGVFAIQRVSAVNNNTVVLSTNYLLAATKLGEVNGSAMRFRQLEATHILASSVAEKAKEEATMTGTLDDVRNSYSAYAATIDPGEERGLNDKLTPLWSRYLEVHEKLMDLSRKGDDKAAQALYVGDMRTTFNQYYDDLHAIMAYQDKGGHAEAQQAADTYRLAWDFIVAAIAMAALLCVAAGFMIVTGVSSPIKRMTNAMGHLAKHDLSTEIDGLGRKDEIGQMAAAVQVFKDSMIEGDRLKAEQETARRRTEERTSRMDELTRNFESSVGSVVQAVASQATQMESSAQSMSATAEETTKQASAVAAASEQSSANVQTVASATEELSSSISEISRQVSQSSQITANAVSEASKANDMVQGLVGASAKIGEIVALINDIADQTNLLALNATIEAARAGEAGKGFAVVAAEVKNLATQTSKATEEISAQITGVQGATQDAVQAIASISKTIGEIDQIATAIAAAVEEQGAATQEIARNVEEAAKGTQEVSSNIGGVTEAANGTGAAAGQVLTAAQALTGQSGHLKDLVQNFLAGVKAA
ncbi:MAG TPA: methyl-accepting chemotaxis protein [Rhizomicrobium sp.]|nr:methyl-accepting chemotaxis protein [Rhizomicrobium sp.]